MTPMIRRLGQGLGALMLVTSLAGCGYQSRTLLDGKVAVPMPVLPMLPMAADQRMLIQGGVASTWPGSTAGRMSDSSRGPLILSPRRLGVGGNFQWRHKAFFAGAEGGIALHDGGMASGLAQAMAGVNVAGEEVSFLAWAGLGLGAGEATYTAADFTSYDNWFEPDSVNDSLYYGTSTSNPLLLSAGLALSVLDKEPVSPFVAGRVMIGLGLGQESDIHVVNSVNFSRTFVDAGVRWRPMDRLRGTAGVGVSWYQDALFSGVDANLYVGMNFTFLKPPLKWKSSR